LVRCVRPLFMVEANALFESMQFDTLRAKVGISQEELTDRRKNELALPVQKFGGWGLRRPGDVSAIAWLSAQAAAAPIIEPLLESFELLPGQGVRVRVGLGHEGKEEKKEAEPLGEVEVTRRQNATEEALNEIALRCGHSNAVSALLPANPAQFLPFFVAQAKQIERGDKEEAKETLQHVLTKAAEVEIFSDLENTGTLDQKCFLKSRTVKNAYHWKLVVGSNWKLKLDDEQMATCVRVEYGLPPVSVESMGPQCGLCRKFALTDPCHFMTCAKTRADEIIKRHNQVCSSFASACRALGHHVTVEPKRLNADDAKRVDLDVTMRLKRFLADVTVRCSTTKEPEAVFLVANREKERKYRSMAREEGCDFVPLAIDAFGGWSDGTEDFIQLLQKLGESRDSAVAAFQITRALRQEISVAVHRFNGKALARGVRHSRAQLRAGG
jgi:hypothetical protein